MSTFELIAWGIIAVTATVVAMDIWTASNLLRRPKNKIRYSR
jgi:hypothetical protein